MQPYISKSKKIHIVHLLLASTIALSFLVGCSQPMKSVDGVTFVSPRGRSVPGQRIFWSPTDENKLMVRAEDALLSRESEVYILDLKTGKKNILVQEASGLFFDTQWTPDGKGALLLSLGDIKGFEAKGWWKFDIEKKDIEFSMDFGDAAWSPDGKTVAFFHERRHVVTHNIISVELQLIDLSTHTIQSVYTSDEVDYTRGISWSPDGQYVVFSLGRTRAMNLYILDMKTLEVKKITENNGSRYPTWSPKGNVIAFERNPPDNIAEISIHLINPDGQCEIEIPNLERAWSPTWSPDGEKLGYVSMDGIYFLHVNPVIGRDIYKNLCL